ncbi:MAG: sulfatase-like hydrolase/transferase, partial [Planctomycetes bacterium]|nr:sulfatase-like hydrolase/transferase [Planctomycetota bacterium]
MNFILIMTDQQPRAHLGCYGNTLVETPNIDRIAREGTRFDAAYTYCPLCTPARSAIFTGRTPERAGGWYNDCPLYDGTQTMGQIFTQAGYRAAYTGKWHLDAEGYWGRGVAAPGWEPEWWYDGRSFADDLRESGFARYLENARDP